MDTDTTPEEDPISAQSDPPLAPALTPEEAEKSHAELETLRDRHVRLQADFDNYRKRTLRERTDAQARATEDVIAALLPALDHFDMGLNSAAEHGADTSVQTGFKMIRDEIFRVLERAGLSAVNAQPGQPFDPHQHESVAHQPSAEFAADLVVKQLRRGYRLGPQLLRPAQVVVSSGAPEGDAHGNA